MSNKKAFAIPLVFVVVFLIMFTVGSFMFYYAPNSSKEFNRDLATIRGYWAVFGAKELPNVSLTLNGSDYQITYNYFSLNGDRKIYEITATKSGNKCTWELFNNGIKNDKLWNRALYMLTPTSNGNNNIQSYQSEENP